MSTPVTALRLCALELQRLSARTRNIANARDRTSRIAALRGLVLTAITSAAIVLPMARLLRGNSEVLADSELRFAALTGAVFLLFAVAEGFRRQAYGAPAADARIGIYLRVAGPLPTARAARTTMRAAVVAVAIGPLALLPIAPLADQYSPAQRAVAIFLPGAIFLLGEAIGALHYVAGRRWTRRIAPAAGLLLLSLLMLGWIQDLPSLPESLKALRLGDAALEAARVILATPTLTLALLACSLAAAFFGLRHAEQHHGRARPGRMLTAQRVLPGTRLRPAASPLAGLRRRDLSRILNRLRTEPVIMLAAFVPGILIHAGMASEGATAVAEQLGGSIRYALPTVALLLPAILMGEALWGADDRAAWGYGRAAGVRDDQFLAARGITLAIVLAAGFVPGLVAFSLAGTPIAALASYALAAGLACLLSTAASLLGGTLALRWGGDPASSRVPRYTAAIAALLAIPALSLWLPRWGLAAVTLAVSAMLILNAVRILSRAEPGRLSTS